jgi:uncharacterized protein YndB with AHSA1/START domain
MSSAPAIPAVQSTVTVAVPVQTAFRVFTEGFDTWWPRTHHIGQVDLAEAVLERREGGRWYERGVDGSECEWGRVLAWEPPHRLVLSWHIGGKWQYDPDPTRASEVEVRFTAKGPRETVVELRHHHLERHEDGQLLHDEVGGEGGWNGLLERFARAAAVQA